MSASNPPKRSFKENLKRWFPVILMLFMLLAVIIVTVIACINAIGGTSSKTTTPEEPLFTHPVVTQPSTEPIIETTTTKATTTAKPKATFAILTETTATIQTTTAVSLPERSVLGMNLSFYDVFMNVGDAPILPVAFMTPDDALDTRIRLESSDDTVAMVTDDGYITAVGAGNCTIFVESISNPNISAKINVTVEPQSDFVTTPEFSTPSETTYTTAIEIPEQEEDGTRHDIQVINGITYVQGIMLVNKTYPLPETYNPNGMTPETFEAFSELQQAAKDEAGLSLFSHSDFRSYHTQAIVYEGYCARDGQEEADRYSARAGYSEHQTGMVIDVNDPSYNFNGTPEAEWLGENCWRFGFIVRFPEGKEEFTGYEYESWHIRYVGKKWAKIIYDSGLCLEEYFNVRSEYP